MQSFICTTCGVGHAPPATPPGRCAICEDERQGQMRGSLGERQPLVARSDRASQGDADRHPPFGHLLRQGEKVIIGRLVPIKDIS